MRAEKSHNSISRFVQTSSYEDMADVIDKYNDDLEDLEDQPKTPVNDRRRCSMIIYRARLLGAMGKTDDAIEGFDEALKIMEADSFDAIPGEDLTKDRVLSFKADTLSLVPSKLNEASLLYQSILENHPKEYNLYYNIAICYDDMLDVVTSETWSTLFDKMVCAISQDGALATVFSVVTNEILSPFSTTSLESFNSLKWIQQLCSTSSSVSSDICSNPEFLISHLGCSITTTSPDTLVTNSTLSMRHLGVYWSLYIAANRLEEYSLAWKFLNIAQQLELNAIDDPYNNAITASVVSNVKEMYKRGFWPDKYIGDDSMMPVFIVGFLRSGATLLESLLDSHKNIISIGDDSILNKYVPLVQGNWTELISRRDLKRSERILTLMNFVKMNSDEILKGTKKRAAKLKKHYKTINGKHVDKVKRVVDKLLANYMNIGIIHLLFPNAIILHVVRDPLDTLLSCYSKRFGTSELSWTMDIHNLVAEYASYLELMGHFRRVTPRKNRLIDVSYESLVINPERVLRDIIVDKLQLPWDPNVINFHKNDRAKRKIYTDSIGRWKNYGKEMDEIINAMNTHMPKLKKLNNIFPYAIASNEEAVNMNWALSKDFDYMHFLMQLVG